MTPCDFLLVIPAYNEGKRLPGFLKPLLQALCDSEHDVQVLVVDDGSSPKNKQQKRRLIEDLQTKYPFLRDLMVQKENQGKGAAVRRGWQDGPQAHWYAFVDADGSISPQEIVRLMNRAKAPQDELHGSIFASRIKMLGLKVERERLRHYWGRIFATLVGWLLHEDVYDSQCGYKLLRAAAWEKIDGRLVEDGFAFDVELLVALIEADEMIYEVPIHWKHQKGSQLSLLRDSIKMFCSLLQINQRRKRGFYKP
ncbi:MAG: glycosyltransferase [Verrucomicrobiota bacterium]